MRTRLLEWLMDGFAMPTKVTGSRFDWQRREYLLRSPDPSQLGLKGKLRLWLIERLAQ